MINLGKKMLAALLLCAVLMTSFTFAVAETGTVRVGDLMLREKPSTSANKLYTLSMGDEVEILGQEGDWYKVRFGKLTGYVYASYIRVGENAEPIPSVDGERDTLVRGDEGEDVKKMQQRLKDLGYFTAKVTGSFGTTTLNAVKAFQEKNNLTVDGLAGPATLKKLYSSSAKKADNTVAGTTVKDDVPATGTLRKGDRSDDVKALQERLKELGYFKNSCTGYYGNATQTAVRAFQSRNGLTADGIAGQSTLKKLNSSSAKPAEGVTVETALRKGDSNDDVKALQERLKELGYFKNNCTGYFGDATETALKKFQSRNGLTADGVAGSNTMKKLNSSSAKAAEGVTVEPEEEDNDETLRKGMSGDEVRKVQQRLKELGYFNQNVTGYYGDVTVSAVKQFQSRNSLTQDGQVGAQTQKKLNSSSAKAAPGYEVDEDAVLYGNSNDNIKAMQQRLKDLGYFKSSCTGYFGDSTQAALKAFQTRNGLSATGLANTATLNKLNSSSAKPAEGYEVAEDDGVLSVGDQGEEVKKMQQRLKDLGYFKTTCTGYFGGQTEEALKKFQARNGLTANGKLSAATEKKLYASSAKPAEGYTVNSGSSSGSSDTVLKKGMKSDEVRTLQTRLNALGYLKTSPTGYYGSQTEDAVEAFQKRNGLTVTGKVDAATMKEILSSSAVQAENATIKTERLDWFNGGKNLIPNGATFQVKDVRTGLIFNAKRQAGYNHMDAEPLTAADTATLLLIYGGKDFSWKRRPMLVKYNGHVYACSIYGEPHGNDTIAGNNYDGQFCLHFYGSRTHESDNLDADHAACEAEALKATW